MKKNKILITIVSIFIIVFILSLFFPSTTDTSEKTNVINEIDKELIYTEKIQPLFTDEIFLDQSLILRNTYVEKDQSVYHGDILFDYYQIDIIDNQIKMIENEFLKLEDDMHYFYTKIDEFKKIKEENTDASYLDYVNNEISNYEAKLAENKINTTLKKEEILQLKSSKDDYIVKSDYDGIIKSINTNKQNEPYIKLYSNEKIIKILVSEFELDYFKVNDSVEVKVEKTNQTYTSKIKSVDLYPVNMNTTEDSLFEVIIEVDSSIGYGLSALIMVPIK